MHTLKTIIVVLFLCSLSLSSVKAAKVDDLYIKRVQVDSLKLYSEDSVHTIVNTTVTLWWSNGNVIVRTKSLDHPIKVFRNAYIVEEESSTIKVIQSTNLVFFIYKDEDNKTIAEEGEHLQD